MANDSPVVLYRYDASPFSHKIDNTLLLKGIPHHIVNVSQMLPRPELSELLGVSYRRIPVLAIGNDIYCDTSIIISALERHFPAEKGYGTLFPPRKGGGKTDIGMIKAFAMYYVDRPLFALASSTLPFHKFGKDFLADRSAMRGSKIDGEAMAARQPIVKSLLSSHMSLLEEQLADGREWLFDTDLPGLADLSVHFLYAWILPFRGMKEVLPEMDFPKSIAWISRVTEFLKKRKEANAAPFKKIEGHAAANLIAGSPAQDLGEIGFSEIEANRLGVKPGGQVTVAPDDTGRSVLTFGKLVGLNREEIVIETKGSAAAVVRCHFPRLNFNVRSTSVAGSKL